MKLKYLIISFFILSFCSFSRQRRVANFPMTFLMLDSFTKKPLGGCQIFKTVNGKKKGNLLTISDANGKAGIEDIIGLQTIRIFRPSYFECIRKYNATATHPFLVIKLCPNDTLDKYDRKLNELTEQMGMDGEKKTNALLNKIKSIYEQNGQLDSFNVYKKKYSHR